MDPLVVLENDIKDYYSLLIDKFCIELNSKLSINIYEMADIDIIKKDVLKLSTSPINSAESHISSSDTNIKLNQSNCCAKTGSGSQCTRKYKNPDTKLCGSHMNRCPYGMFI